MVQCERCHFYGKTFHGDPWVLVENLEGKKPDRLICPSCGHVMESNPMTKRIKETGGRGWIGEPNVTRTKLKRKRKKVI